MSRWTDLLPWKGPSPHITAGGMAEHRGLILHIASGTYAGTISWQMNTSASSPTSSHFIVGRDQGNWCQMVDTADRAWAEIEGNSRWLSVELEGFTPGDSNYRSGWETATSWQIQCVGRLLARGAQQYGYPLQLATAPSGQGLGHHSMGAESGVNWGHSGCPGSVMKSQKPAMLAVAQGGSSVSVSDDILSGFAGGNAHVNGTYIAPVDWEVRREAREAKADAFQAAIMVAVQKIPTTPAAGATLSDAQVQALATALGSNTTFASAVASAVVAKLDGKTLGFKTV